MIITEKIKIKLCWNNKKYWKSLNYDVENIFIPKNGILFEVYAKDLKKGSNEKVKCKCDVCGVEYIQRFCRNTDVCGTCVKKNVMKGNINGSKNIKYSIPSKEKILSLLKNGGKSLISKTFNVSIPVVNAWFKKHDIKIVPYHGRKLIKDKNKENEIVELLKKLSNENILLNDILKQVPLSKSAVIYLCKKHGIQYMTIFDEWEIKYKEILNNLSFYVKENETKQLVNIASENEISIHNLKRAFKENEIDVKLHGFNKSNGELELKQYIIHKGFDCFSFKLERMFEIDCYVPSLKLGIEYCGEYWHSDIQKDSHYHKNKLDFFQERDIRILHIFENEWLNKNEIVKSIIDNKLGLSKRIHARKCNVNFIDSKQANRFHEVNHLSGYINSSVNIGLFYGKELISVISFIKSRFDKKYQYEISRFSTKLGFNVSGGLSKMFSYFIKNIKLESCMTYADLRIGNGKSYEKIGFKKVGVTKPNYFYYNKKTGEMHSRIKFQKHKLKDMISYDEEKTEYEIMSEEGYLRIYDCGNAKYEWFKE